MGVDTIILWYFEHLQPITTLTGVFACVISCIKQHAQGDFAIESMGRAATWCALPSGVAFVVCSAYPIYVPKLADATIAFLMGGIGLILVAVCDYRKLFKPLIRP